MIWPVYEFRPLSGFFRGQVRRYADRKWLPDDGEYDLAFIGMAESGEGWTYPCCLMFEPPYQRNIVCSWTTTHWSAVVDEHPGGNAWHYALREGKNKWGGDWGRDRHPNYIAGREGMSKICDEKGCANGRHVEFYANDPHIAAGLLRERDTKKVFEWPQNMECMFCGAAPPVKMKCDAA